LSPLFPAASTVGATHFELLSGGSGEGWTSRKFEDCRGTAFSLTTFSQLFTGFSENEWFWGWAGAKKNYLSVHMTRIVLALSNFLKFIRLSRRKKWFKVCVVFIYYTFFFMIKLNII